MLVIIAIAWWWGQPKTPKEIFEDRCSTCHAMPDLATFQDHQILPLVKNMRENHGAAEVIDDHEAELIVDYIITQRRENEPSQKSR